MKTDVTAAKHSKRAPITVRKERVEEQLDEELRGFLEIASEVKMKQGMSRKDALRAVRLEEGNVEVTKENVCRSLGIFFEDLLAGFALRGSAPSAHFGFGWVQLIEGRMAFPVRKRRQIGHLAFLLLWLRTRRSGVRVPPGAPFFSQVFNYREHAHY